LNYYDLKKIIIINRTEDFVHLPLLFEQGQVVAVAVAAAARHLLRELGLQRHPKQQLEIRREKERKSKIWKIFRE